MHRTNVTVAEDALDANSTIAQANRADFDRQAVRVVNLMSAPGAGKTALLERVLGGLDGVRPGVENASPEGTEELARAYRSASVTVLPSEDEAFGLFAENMPRLSTIGASFTCPG